MPLLKGTSPTTKAMSCSSRTEKAALIALGATLALALRAALNRSLRAKKRVLARSTASSLPKEVVSELFSRNLAFFGEDGFEHIREAFVVVVGLGGVGSHAAHMLARAGVRRLRVIDFDQVSLSSLNRHATALWSDVGTPKADSLANSLRKTIPNIEIEAINRMFR
jgi:tRNA A37 threonylcarbamoyladenosine dehydratase